MTPTMTQPTGKPNQTLRQTLTGLVQTYLAAPAGPIQQLVRKATGGDVLSKDKEYELISALATLENLYNTAQRESFEVMTHNSKLEQALNQQGITYQTQESTPIVIHFDIDTALTPYDGSTTNKKGKVAKIKTLQTEVDTKQAEYLELAQDLETQKTQRTYLTLKVALHGIKDPFAKNDVEEYEDAVATLLKTDKKQQDAKYEQKRLQLASVRIIGELYSQDYTLSGNYDVKTLGEIHTPQNIRAYFHNSEELESTVNALVDQNKRTDYTARKENRIKLTELVKQHPEYQTAAFNIAKGIAVKENALAEEVGIALANATNQSQYWQFVGDLIGTSKTANRPDRKDWQEICYTNAKQVVN